MTSLSQDIQYKLKRLNAFEKIIGINVVVFLISLILFKAYGTSLHWFEMPKRFGDFIHQPWSIFTYGFVHYGFWHVALNMLILYFISQMMLNLFRTKMALNVYFLGILCGGLAFLLVYNLFPQSQLKNVGTLVGASAGVRALIIFLSAYMPHKEARLMTFNIKLWYIGVAMVVIDVLGLFSLNQGGYVAHLGGSLLGYVYAQQLSKGKDIGKRFESFMNKVEGWFKPKSPLKTVHRRKSKSFAGHNKEEFNEFTKQKRIDLILDKIGKSGYESLTQEEKSFLFKAGKD
ncbi:rhomboid family intramembrane serine protease [Mangrovimonas sp. TPBH4]|uniref:rhomboid family intramembrane serine protease n=1 Tax=Mangrovimonas sp. TPBH4 TaxID=1645914 RepID=UPI0006B486CB|nr:rhomboid family intramembrane serine protease [Mangrovimonas sp. TPBH4]